MEFPKLKALLEANEHTEVADSVIQKLKDWYPDADANADEYKMLHADAVQKSKEGWTSADIFAYMKNNEAINPNLDEDKALANMKRISDKYKKQ